MISGYEMLHRPALTYNVLQTELLKSTALCVLWLIVGKMLNLVAINATLRPFGTFIQPSAQTLSTDARPSGRVRKGPVLGSCGFALDSPALTLLRLLLTAAVGVDVLLL